MSTSRDTFREFGPQPFISASHTPLNLTAAVRRQSRAFFCSGVGEGEWVWDPLSFNFKPWLGLHGFIESTTSTCLAVVLT
ncbi:hypothetical protein BVC80_4893g1 [Macleaya cordata]|uniref:Uncharacterized protein n=1 Tax=Macleaya cordata TaxID=56857 RepID=A0A200Q378_MACCD|nr:hypothetical protein BVC80_4893g1 [Macleaya cordata]